MRSFASASRLVRNRRRPRNNEVCVVNYDGRRRQLSSSNNAGKAVVSSSQNSTTKRRIVKISEASSTKNDAVHPTAYDEDKLNATKLVDDLLEYTQTLMTTTTAGAAKRGKHHPPPTHHIIAFSGGIDSSVATALVHQVANDSNDFSNHAVVTAALGISPAVPKDQILLAEQVAQHIGVDLHQINTTEGKDSEYIANEGRACLACKTHLYTCLSSIAEHYGRVVIVDGNDHDDNALDTKQQSTSSSTSHVQLYNGTNADDLQDPTRLGLIAAANFDVQSPLEHTSKALVRLAGQHLGLPNWNFAASPCLRSRLALGVQAIPQHLQKIERAEQFVRSMLKVDDYDPTINLRVRLLAGNNAMIEVDESLLTQVQESMDSQENGRLWETTFVDNLGFGALNVRAFQTGSVAKR